MGSGGGASSRVNTNRTEINSTITSKVHGSAEMLRRQPCTEKYKEGTYADVDTPNALIAHSIMKLSAPPDALRHSARSNTSMKTKM